MSKRPMPDWMMRYISNIGTDECYNKFRELSKNYYEEIDAGGDRKPRAVERFEMLKINRVLKEENPYTSKSDKALFDINEKYKELSRELACKHGYDIKKPLEKMYENDPTLNNRELVSHEDRIAKGLHKDFKEQHPEKSAKAKNNEKKYRNWEYEEYNNEIGKERSTIMFDKLQDNFEAKRQDAIKKSNEAFVKNPEKDTIKPVSNNAHSDKTKIISDKSDTKKSFEQNKSDLTNSRASNRYFSLIDVVNNNLDKPIGKDKSTVKPDMSKLNKNNSTEQSKASERYFDNIGLNQNKDDITTEKPDVDKSEPAEDKTSKNKSNKSVDFDKD